ncbi:MAG: deoxyguanosinetriphosphate triphosphohydrolase [Candidatus Muiribacteriota bacterium]
MIIRKKIEEFENIFLDKELAQTSSQSRGRVVTEKESELRTCYQRDRDRIIHCAPFRRLKDKTQVFIIGDFIHPRTRLTHTLEVAQIARTIARALKMNEDLVEAIALGHDIGHTPFGHLGEKVLNQRSENGFHHSRNSLRIVDKLAKKDKGLNLTAEVRDGILKHSKDSAEIDSFALDCGPPVTNEAYIVRYSDGIAYLNHDIEDSLNMNYIKFEDFPSDCMEILGKTHGKRVDTMVKSLIENSLKNKTISLKSEVLDSVNKLRKFMFEEVYKQADKSKGSIEAKDMLNYIWDYYFNKPYALLEDFKITSEYDTVENMVKDNISQLTDKEACIIYSKIK